MRTDVHADMRVDIGVCAWWACATQRLEAVAETVQKHSWPIAAAPGIPENPDPQKRTFFEGEMLVMLVIQRGLVPKHVYRHVCRHGCRHVCRRAAGKLSPRPLKWLQAYSRGHSAVAAGL